MRYTFGRALGPFDRRIGLAAQGRGIWKPERRSEDVSTNRVRILRWALIPNDGSHNPPEIL